MASRFDHSGRATKAVHRGDRRRRRPTVLDHLWTGRALGHEMLMEKHSPSQTCARVKLAITRRPAPTFLIVHFNQTCNFI